MEDERQSRELSGDGALRESVRVQKTLYMQEQLKKRRQAEEHLLEQLLKEQQVIDRLQNSLDENMERTAETRQYNEELKDSMEQQVYALHGITEDKLMGMREYKNAYYRGCAAALFLLSAGMVVLCGVLHGFGAEISLLMLACTALEGALLAQERKRILFLDVLCRLLYLFLFPVMLILFVCYELGYQEYDFFLPYVSMGALVLTVLGTVSYFVYNPYRKERRKIRSARSQIGEIEKIAGKEVRKNRKSRAKEEEAALRKQEREEAAAVREERRRERAEIRSEKRKGLLESGKRHLQGGKERLRKFWNRKQEQNALPEPSSEPSVIKEELQEAIESPDAVKAGETADSE